MKQLILSIACCVCASAIYAQNSTSKAPTMDGYRVDTTISGKKAINFQKDTLASSSKQGGYISIGSGGVVVSNKKKDSLAPKRFHVHFISLDLGVNALNDRTDYSSAGAQQYLQVPGDRKNGNLFSMRTSKSINVNIWPVLFDYTLFKSKGQKILLYSGVGMQFYNFRFTKNISYLNTTSPMVIEDSVSFSKNKLAFAYASIPLMLNFKTRMAKGFWLVYGVGAIGGYAFDTWTKQISDERGKQKNHDQFNFQRFNLNLSGEIGIENYIRLYATYQVTNMYQNSLVQNPYCIGIRFLGI
ncbi:hypothetical protein F0919_11340 [Taibaiella lutea]|uniref:Outer membrane protein beta-barrel domain-containing protein n=1 Tax=Taibaiella lutea TaxID=2608001 RepID=A0A5M6CDK3_9BACT|nr:hypothetical protein [Taibaiella lutea]KAA5533137.1 hypothetical protein F0919_11340 [Taibaiella lutea]